MECGICERPLGTRRKPLCTACAQASLYNTRLNQATALLSREKAHNQAEAIVRPGNDGVLAALPENADWDVITAGIKTRGSDRDKANAEAADERVREITAKAEMLRQQIKDYKAFAAEKKLTNEKRRQDLSVERRKLEKHRSQALEPVLAATRRARHRLDKTHNRTAEARGYLCREVGLLCGLRRIKDENGKTEYRLGGIPIPDLRDTNGINGRIKADAVRTSTGVKQLSEPHELLSAAYNNVCLLLGLCCNYLSIRPPAEIIAMHNDFPHVAMLQRDASYRNSHPIFPGFASSRTTSPSASRLLSKDGQPKPRVLQLDRPLPQLQKEDAKSAGLFIEGIMLLAYDIAWLCRTQGLDSVDRFDDVCDIGRNLRSLFSGREHKSSARPALDRNVSSATTKTDTTVSSSDANSKPTFGAFSHASVHHSLAGHEGLALFEPWKVSLTKLTDSLSSYLRNETARAEWHIVDENEWDEEMGDEHAVLVGGVGRRPLGSKEPAMSIMTATLPGNDKGVDDGGRTLGIETENGDQTKVGDRGDGGNT